MKPKKKKMRRHVRLDSTTNIHLSSFHAFAPKKNKPIHVLNIMEVGIQEKK